jgi:hypothetical protein
MEIILSEFQGDCKEGCSHSEDVPIWFYNWWGDKSVTFRGLRYCPYDTTEDSFANCWLVLYRHMLAYHKEEAIILTLAD